MMTVKRALRGGTQGVFAAALFIASSGAALASHCSSDEPYVYVWGQGMGGDYYYTPVFEAGDGDSASDLVAVFAEKVREQYGDSPSSKPSRCFATEGEAEADRDLRMARQSGEDQHDIDW